MRRAIQKNSARAAVVAAAVAAALVVGASLSSGQFPMIFFRQSAVIDLGEDHEIDPALQSITLADVDDDGNDDLIVLDDFNVSFLVYLSNGDGTFEDPEEFNLEDAIGAVAVTAADVSSPFSSDAEGMPDGNIDLVIVADTEVVIVPGLGDGEFATGDGETDNEVEVVDVDDLSDTGASFLHGVATGFFNGDQILDIVALDDDLVVLLCNRSGSFDVCEGAADPVTVVDGVLAELVDFALGDFDGDSNTDVAVLEPNDGGDTAGGQFYVLFGNGDATFATGSVRPFATLADMSPRALAVGRVDEDNLDDIVICNFDTLSLDNIETRFGTQGRRDFPRTATGFTELQSVDLQLADFDDDNFLDLVAAGFPVGGGGGGSSVVAGNGTGSFDQAFGLPGLLARLASVVVGDVDGDNLPDIAGVRPDGLQIAVGLNVSDEATPTPGSPTPNVTNTAGPSPTPSATSTPEPTNTPTPIPTVGSGLCDIVPSNMPEDEPGSLTAIVAAQLDDGARADIAVSDATNNVVRILLNTDQLLNTVKSCARTRNEGGESASAEASGGASLAGAVASETPEATATVGEGTPTATRTPTRTPTFTPSVTPSPNQAPVSSVISVPAPGDLAAVDVDGDDRLDIVVLSGTGLRILRNTGGGNFVEPEDSFVAIGGRPVQIVADYVDDFRAPTERKTLDLNGDGDADLIVANAGNQGLSVNILYGVEGSGFEVAEVADVGFNTSATAGDFDGDGDVDIAVATNGRVAFLVQTVPGARPTFVLRTFVAFAGTLNAIEAAFFTGDAFPDIAGIGTGANLQVLRTNPSALGQSMVANAFVVPPNGTALASLFFDRGSTVDVVVGTSSGLTDELRFGLGDRMGGFPLLLNPYAINGPPRDIAVLDFDGDGRLDVATANSNGTISILVSSEPPPTPTPTDTPTPTMTGTATETGTPTPTTEGTATPEGTRTPTRHTPTPKPGAFGLSGSGCSVDERAGGSALSLLWSGALILLALSRRRRRSAAFRQSVAVIPGLGTVSDSAPRSTRAAAFVLACAVSFGVLAAAGGPASAELPDYFGCEVAASRLSTVGGDLTAGAVANFNFIGHLSSDLVLLDEANSRIVIVAIDEVVLNHEACAGAVTPTTLAAAVPLAVTAAFVNGDQFADVVVGGQIALNVALGNGSGGFEGAGGSPLAVPRSAALATTNLNNDSFADVLASSEQGTENFVVVLSSNGETLQIGSVIPVDSFVRAVGAADLAAVGGDDGLRDVLVLAGGQILLYRQLSNLEFLNNADPPQPEEYLLRSEDGMEDFKVADRAADGLDFDGNSVPDLAVLALNPNGGLLTILTGRSPSANPGLDLRDVKMLDFSPTSFALGDLDDDDALDVVVVGTDANGDGVVATFLGNGNGTLMPPVLRNLGAGFAPTLVLVGDFDADSILDVAVTSGADASLTLLLSHQNGLPTFTPTATATATLSPSVTESPSVTPTATPTNTPTATETVRATRTPTPTITTTPGLFELRGEGCTIDPQGGGAWTTALLLTLGATLLLLMGRVARP